MTNRIRYDCKEETLSCKNNDINYIDKKHPVPGELILKTGYGSLGPITLDFTSVSTITINKQIARTRIDTSCMRNLKFLIEFNGILNITANTADVFTFNFALTRLCKNTKVLQDLTTFTFNFLYPFSENLDSRTLKFEYSPCDDLCEDCCTYILEITSIQSNSNNSSILDFNISSGLISILGVDSKNSSCFSDMNNKNSGNALLSVKSNKFYSRNLTFTAPNLLNTLNQPIAAVNLDTSLIKKPKLLLDFTGILNIVPVDTTVDATLYFTLFKLCKGSIARTPLTTFTFTNNNFFIYPNSETLKFEYSPCDENCFECCTYILELTSVSNPFEGTFNLSINKGTFSVLAFDCCLNRCDELPGNSIFASNESSFYAGPNYMQAGQLTQILNLPIASTTIDISKLNVPKLLIDFNGILHVDAYSSITISYNFTLYRTCKNSNVLQPLTTFVYNSINYYWNKSSTLKFEYSPEDGACSDCCTYIFELTSITAHAPTFIYDISITKSVLSILAVESCK